MTKKQQESYEAPTTKLIDLRVESSILQGSYNPANHTELYNEIDGGDI